MAIPDAASVARLQDAFTAGGLGAVAMVRDYLGRIEAYDRSLPSLGAVRAPLSNDQSQIAERDCASCICRKSTGGFFL
jgi:Asp-tRNA(Asn)/Glu-tRNA(Gln) amidotransferase A subunit family amidase